tara:strand:- start:424 stop:609 length:186 start_codon:yes stop_codon:yes gene_type:complete
MTEIDLEFDEGENPKLIIGGFGKKDPKITIDLGGSEGENLYEIAVHIENIWEQVKGWKQYK